MARGSMTTGLRLGPALSPRTKSTSRVFNTRTHTHTKRWEGEGPQHLAHQSLSRLFSIYF